MTPISPQALVQLPRWILCSNPCSFQHYLYLLVANNTQQAPRNILLTTIAATSESWAVAAIFSEANGFMMLLILFIKLQLVLLLINNLTAKNLADLINLTSSIGGSLSHVISQGK